MEKITSVVDFQNRINKDTVNIAIFRGEWCPDCHFIDPFMEEVSNEFSPEVEVFNVDIEEFNSIAGEHQVMGIPSFVAFKKGKEINRFVNRARKTREEITSFFKETLSN